jgi:O-antigen ligase
LTTLRNQESQPLVFLALLAYTISVYTALGERLDFLSVVRHELLLGTALIGLSITTLMENPLTIEPYRKLVIAIVLLFFIMLTQIPFAFDPQIAWNTFFDKIVKQAMFTLFIVSLVRSPRQLRWFMAAFLFAIFWVLQEAMYGLVTGSLVWVNQGIERLHGAVRLYRHPNGLSLISVTGICFILYLIPVVRRWYLKLFLLGMVGMAGLCIVYTGSRAGYVGIIAVIFFWWFFSRHKIKGALAGVVGGALLLIVLPTQYKERFLSIGGEEAAGHSKEARLLLIKDAWEIYQDNPFGIGIDCFLPMRVARYGRTQGTHNLYLQVATHLGIQGFIIFMFFAATLALSCHSVAQRLERIIDRSAGLARRVRGDPRRRARFATLWHDTVFLGALARAGRMYILMLLVNGVFAHTLYLICWWFSSGLAIILLNMAGVLEAEVTRTQRQLAAEAEAQDDDTATAPLA